MANTVFTEWFTTKWNGYAEWWRRLGALVIDICVCLLISLVVISVGTILGIFKRTEVIAIATLIFPIYLIVMECSKKSTYGKRVFGIIVETIDGRQLSFFHSVFRTFCKFISLIVPFNFPAPLLSFVMIGVSNRHQALHDWMAKTVVRRNKS